MIHIELQRIAEQDDCYLSCGDRDMLNEAADLIRQQAEHLREADELIRRLVASNDPDLKQNFDNLGRPIIDGATWLEKRKAVSK